MQERVTFEKEIRLAMQQKETDERGHDDPEEDVEDPDEWWRLLQDGGEQESYVPESILSQNYTPLQANRLMHAFMPTTGQPEELGYLFLAIALGIGFGAARGWETSIVMIVLLAVTALRSGLPGGRSPLRTVLQVSASESLADSPVDTLWPVIEQNTDRAELRRVDFDGREFFASAMVEIDSVAGLQGLIQAVRETLPGASVSVVERDTAE